MTTVTLYTLASVFAVSLISLAGLFTLSLNERVLRKILFALVSLAVGALLGGAFIHLIPEAFEQSTNILTTSLLVVAGILTFFCFEKILHWHHYHGSEKEHCLEYEESLRKKIHPVGYSILLSDGIHNFIDGVIIAASYLVSIEVGIATTIAVVIHEIPQEFGDFGVLIHAGFSTGRALLMNFLSAFLAVLGAVFMLVLGSSAQPLVIWALPFAAGSFIYIAVADLLPELRKTTKITHSLVQILGIFIGLAAMVLLLGLDVH